MGDFFAPSELPTKAVKMPKPRKAIANRIMDELFEGTPSAESATTTKYTINFNKNIDEYLRNGYSECTLAYYPDSPTGELALRVALSKHKTSESRRLTFKHGASGGSTISDPHPRFLTALKLTDRECYQLVNPELVGETYIFRALPFDNDGCLETPDPKMAISAPKMGNRIDELATQRLHSRSVISEFRAYRSIVTSIMEENERHHGHLFGNPELRGQANIARDHIYSVFEAFKNGVRPEVVSHPSNLQYVSTSFNSSKGDRCDKSIEQLYLDAAGGNGMKAMQLMREDMKKTNW